MPQDSSSDLLRLVASVSRPSVSLRVWQIACVVAACTSGVRCAAPRDKAGRGVAET